MMPHPGKSEKKKEKYCLMVCIREINWSALSADASKTMSFKGKKLWRRDKIEAEAASPAVFNQYWNRQIKAIKHWKTAKSGVLKMSKNYNILQFKDVLVKAEDFVKTELNYLKIWKLQSIHCWNARRNTKKCQIICLERISIKVRCLKNYSTISLR